MSIEKKTTKLHIEFETNLKREQEFKLISFFQVSIHNAAKRLRNFEQEISKFPIPEHAKDAVTLMCVRAKAQAENIHVFFSLNKKSSFHYIFSFPNEDVAFEKLANLKINIPRPETFGLKERIPSIFAKEFKMKKDSIKTYFEK